MKKQYASSVYSQKSTTSAKSGRSYLSLTTLIWPSSSSSKSSSSAPITTVVSDDITLNEAKQGILQSLKDWIPTASSSSTTKKTTITTIPSIKKKKQDSDSIITTRSSSSISKLKHFFVGANTNKKNIKITTIEEPSSSSSSPSIITTEEDNDTTTTSSSTIDYNKKKYPMGILINRGEDSAEAIAERKKRRQLRRENILRLQNHHRSLLQYHHHDNNNNVVNILQQQEISSSSSSSADTLLTPTTTTTTTKRMVGFVDVSDNPYEEQDDYEYYNPRIMFFEHSPVPRFRNVAPPPPPSPPYLNILIHEQDEENESSPFHSIIQSPLQDEESPTIFASKHILFNHNDNPTKKQPLYNEQQEEEEEEEEEEEDQQKSYHIQKPRLFFYPPFYRGQTLMFRLENTIPQDHIILFKFLTSNNNITSKGERYFIRPSAGKIVNTNKEIMLFLNQVVPNIKKDKIMIRWAVIQRNTKIEQWVNQLEETTRRKWIDMLDNEWPNQVTIRMTRIRVRFSPVSSSDVANVVGFSSSSSSYY